MRRPAWVSDLLAFARPMLRIPVKPTRATKLKGLWRFSDVQDSEVSTLREVVRLGERLASLQRLPEWSALLEVKESLQAISEQTCRMRPGAEGVREDRLRAIAAAEWWAVETFFSTVSRTITHAEQAKKRLRSMVVPLP